jgi:acyl-CoA ligase (AMP-forming) (exosortase A-associated)
MIQEPDFKGGLPPTFLHDLPARAARCWPDAQALVQGDAIWTFAQLQARVERWAGALVGAGLPHGARVAILTDKQFDTVAATLAVTRAHGVVVPVNPLLKPAQVVHVLQDAGVWGLVTQQQRLDALTPTLHELSALRQVVLIDQAALPQALDARAQGHAVTGVEAFLASISELACAPSPSAHQPTEHDLAAIFYTSGSTGHPKGVMLSHRNLVAGAASVVSYLGNTAQDTLLAVLPLSFDAGFSQLTTALLAGARVVLLNYLMPMDVVIALERHAVTGLTAVPPLYSQLAGVAWPQGAGQHLRYWANTGGRMPRGVLQAMQARVPHAAPFLMYGLTESFRSTFLPPDEVVRRPDSIGKAIPNVDIQVVRPDGTACHADEPGQLVHRGPLVSLGYWGRPEATAERFRTWPQQTHAEIAGVARPEVAVFSGDLVRRDVDGFLYFVGREDDMIKTSGYRISPTEIEEVALACPLVAEAVAVGVASESLGHEIRLVVTCAAQGLSKQACTDQLIRHFKQQVPAYMVPRSVWWVAQLPRTPNGKLDRLHWRDHAGL